MTAFAIRDEIEDFATLEFTPGQDDPFQVSGYGARNGVTLSLPLYRHEARELIELLTPLAYGEAKP